MLIYTCIFILYILFRCSLSITSSAGYEIVIMVLVIDVLNNASYNMLIICEIL